MPLQCYPYSDNWLHNCIWPLSMKAGLLSSTQMDPFVKAKLILCSLDMVTRHFVQTSLLQSATLLNTSANLLMSPSAAPAASSSPNSSCYVTPFLCTFFFSHLSLCVQLNDPRESHFLPSPPSGLLFPLNLFPSLITPPCAMPPSLFPSLFFSSQKGLWIKTMQSLFLAKDKD